MDVNMTAEEFCRYVWQKYLVERRYDILDEVIDEQISVIGTGAHEMCPNVESFITSITRESQEWDGAFIIKDQWYQTTELSDILSLVIGELAVKENGEDGILYDMRFRFTIVLRKTATGWKLLHVHQSVPDANQARDEFFPHRMVEESSRQVIYNLRHDTMTGLLNRLYLKEIVNRAMAEEAAGKMLMMDVDDFKSLNDRYGHPFGDKVLILFAQSLKTSFPQAMIGRIGGDEFIAYLPGRSDTVRDQIDRLLQDWKESQGVLALPQQVTLSIGIAEVPKDGDNYEAVWQKADKALYQAKENGKAQIAGLE